ncbi:hypothetical protein BH09DEP1_BH09DEP1_3470 [soil metagenome]
MKKLITKLAIISALAISSCCNLISMVRPNLGNEQATKDLHELLAQPAVMHEASAGCTPGLLEKVNKLIALEADVNARDDGTTPLVQASFNLGNSEVVKALIAAGADVNAQNAAGDTALHTLLSSDFSNALQKGCMLINAGADVNKKNFNGETPLMIAAATGITGIFKLLVDAGADVNAQDNRGTTALMTSAYTGIDPAGIALLLELRADRNITNNNGETALDIALQKRYQKNIDVLMAPQIQKIK